MNGTNEHPLMETGGRNWHATGRVTEDGFVVFKGSSCSKTTEFFKKDKYYLIKVELEKTGIISEDGSITQDYIFRTAGQAACVLSASFAGSSIWKSEDGRKYNEVYPKKSGEKRDTTKATEAKIMEEEAPLGESVMKDGTIRTVVERDGLRIESRGRIPCGGSALMVA